MTKKPMKPSLKVVKNESPDGQSFSHPPRKLAEHGQALWTSIMSEYDITDRGGIEILMQACSALDLAEECSDQINVAGPTIMTKSGMREHALLKCELANRAFVCRSLQRLGLNLEVIKNPGRPGGWRR
jgi:hypothetical protein